MRWGRANVPWASPTTGTFFGGVCVSLFTPPAQAGGQDESPGGRGRGEGRQQ